MNQAINIVDIEEALLEVFSEEAVGKWRRGRVIPPELQERLDTLASPNAPDPYGPYGPIVFRRARRVAWGTYLAAAKTIGILDRDVVSRLRSKDPDQFRAAMAECEGAWLLARGLLLPLVPRPAGRDGSVLEFSFRAGAADIHVEIKAPQIEERVDPKTRSVSDNGALGKCLDNANRQFHEDCANALIIVPSRTGFIGRMSWKLQTAFYGHPKAVFVMDRERGRLKESRWDFEPDGKLLKEHPELRFRRIGAILCLEDERTVAPLVARGVEARTIAPYCVRVLHNPHAHHPIDPSVFGDIPQLVLEGDQMAWRNGLMPHE